MKSLSSVIALSLLGLVSVAHAEEGYSYSDWARVTRVTPQYERINTPRRECKSEIISSYERQPEYSSGNNRSIGGALIGGVVGGVVGNRFGKGNGRTAATALGAVIGAVTGDRIDNGDHYNSRVEYEPQEREIKRCRVLDNWENRLTGYQVDYDYNGHAYSRFMTEDPGRKFKVRVSVEPE